MILGDLDETALQDWMTKRLAQELGVPVEAVDPRASFKNLGVDSLSLVGIAGELAERAGRELPAEVLWEHDTVESIAHHVAALPPDGSLPPESRKDGVPDGTTSNPYLSAAASWSPIRAIQPHGGRSPLFMVHGVTGAALEYQELSRHLDDGQPLYALEAPPYLLETVEEMADLYLDAVRTVQRKGPYRLGGYCFGGVVAYEMASRLHAEGEEVSLLALLDVDPPNTPRRPLKDAAVATLSVGATLAREPNFVLKQVIGKPGRLTGYLKRRGRRWTRRVQKFLNLSHRSATEEFSSTFWEGHRDNVRHNVQAFNAYVPGTYPGPLTLFVSTSPARATAASHWHTLTTGTVDVVRIPCFHDGMLTDAHAPRVAEQLTARLESAG